MITSELSFLREAAPPPEGMPKYAHLTALLRSAIEEGRWKPGDKLPTEATLTRLTPYSLGTVQRALRSLVEEGVVVRRQGDGSFVADGARQAMEDPWHCRFIGDDGRSFLPVYPRVLSRVRTSRHGPWVAALAPEMNGVDSVPAVVNGKKKVNGSNGVAYPDPGTPDGAFVRIDRLLRIDDEFSVYSIFMLRADKFAYLIDAPVEQLDSANFKKIVSNELALPITDLFQDVVAEHIAPTYARAMGLMPGTDGLRLDITARAARGEGLYWQRLIIPPTDRRLCMDTRFPSRDRG